MMIEHTIPASEVWELTEPIVDKMTTEVAAKIKELNGDKTVSAAFIVGGGGKIHGYTELLAQKLDLPAERVALRGEEVLQEVIFEQKDIKKDPLLVTPIGICLNYYDQKNSFIMVRFNGERVKLYDNNKLTIVDAALQAGFPNEDLFPKRGKELTFFVNGATRIIRGEAGESAQIFMNGRPASINTILEPNSEITIEPSTAGAKAVYTLEQLEEYTESSVVFIVNGKRVRCPKFLEVNGSLELPSYQIKEGDAVETRSYYTVGQLVEFMDVELDKDRDIVVNNRFASLDTLIYENFAIDWTVLSFGTADFSYVPTKPQEEQNEEAQTASGEENADAATDENANPVHEKNETGQEETKEQQIPPAADATQEPSMESEPGEEEQKGIGITVYVNDQPVHLTGKDSYIFVDIFDFYKFNLSEANGRAVITNLNGQNAVYTAQLNAGDHIELGWRENGVM
jgi:hypothetical protein